jgi:hypothetical protein
MFSQTWKKYLPVIAILLKRSANGEQTVTLNNTDFERAAGGRKIKYSFSQLQLNKGRINTDAKHSPFAKELAILMQEDDNIQKLLVGQYFEFSLNNQFLFTIKNNAPEAEVVVETIEETGEMESEATETLSAE